ncbi:Hypothetical predicted protein [Olea europaea subsp. europaea]|uniref:Uncharacterized protein n=1 Tax=Olea europaea subsp. europaea TaxID=158383 RepID=A0A8S0RNC0_OLEEU|nr:Hypothetical predicted protein [Olea europaea subsp. europaea]
MIFINGALVLVNSWIFNSMTLPDLMRLMTFSCTSVASGLKILDFMHHGSCMCILCFIKYFKVSCSRQSLLEENGSGIHAASSVNFSPTPSNEYMMPSNLSRDLISESKTVQDHIDNTRHLQDLEKYTFSASPDCKNEAKNDPFMLATAMEVDVPFSLEHNSADKHITEEKISLEESVYLELRSLTVQLTENTRICIRDALYRLAKNSKHEETKHIQEGNEAPAECSPTTYSETSRLDDTDEEESTNAIDRTVANLLFHNINIFNPAPTETEDEVKCSFYNHNPCFSISSHGAVPDGEAEVPIFDNGLSYSTKMVDGD